MRFLNEKIQELGAEVAEGTAIQWWRQRNWGYSWYWEDKSSGGSCVWVVYKSYTRAHLWLGMHDGLEQEEESF